MGIHQFLKRKIIFEVDENLVLLHLYSVLLNVLTIYMLQIYSHHLRCCSFCQNMGLSSLDIHKKLENTEKVLLTES